MRSLCYYHEIEDQYEEMLNDCYDTVNICGLEYEQGQALRLIDEVAFRCGCSDWSSEEFTELRYSQLTEEEREYYMLSEDQVMYCHNDDVEEG